MWYDKQMELFDIERVQVKSIQTKSRNKSTDIAVTTKCEILLLDYRCGDLAVYVVPPVVISRLSYTVIMIKEKPKVVRYSCSTENQTSLYNKKIQPLYSSDVYSKYISENRNLDICVSDRDACAVMVSIKPGNSIRFTYTGPPSLTNGSFNPRGITTDSQGRILIADSNNKYIHILNQDGYILRYIDNCDLRYPWGLCVDSRDNLFVAECRTGRIKKIEYSK